MLGVVRIGDANTAHDAASFKRTTGEFLYLAHSHFLCTRPRNFFDRVRVYTRLGMKRNQCVVFRYFEICSKRTEAFEELLDVMSEL